MVRLKYGIILFLIAIGVPVLACEEALSTPYGFYADCRGEIRDSYIKPPHPENIPSMSQRIENVVDYESNYRRNSEGYRGREGKLPLIPSYTENYSDRTVTYYSKEDYINVWCDGKKHVGKVDCLTKDYAISFFPLSSWSSGIAAAAWRARKLPQQGVAALYIEDSGANGTDMYEAKKWAQKWGAKILFISIDSGVPLEWVQ